MHKITFEEFKAEALQFREFMGSRAVMSDPDRIQGCIKGLSHAFLGLHTDTPEHEVEQARRLWLSSLDEMMRRETMIAVNPPPWA